jgi:hypothetical protein
MKNINHQKQLATDLGSRALSVKTNEEPSSAIRYPFGHLSDDAQKDALTNELFESLNVKLNAIGLAITEAALGFVNRKSPQEYYEGLVRARLVPVRAKVEAAKSTGDVPSWLEGNLC